MDRVREGRDFSGEMQYTQVLKVSFYISLVIPWFNVVLLY